MVAALATTVAILTGCLIATVRALIRVWRGRTDAEQEARDAEQHVATWKAAVKMAEANTAVVREQLATSEEDLALARMTIAAVCRHTGDAPIGDAMGVPADLGKKRAAKKAVSKS